jgi:hypothetical protein
VQEASILQVGFATIPACIAANARCLLFHADVWKRVQNRTDVGSMIPAPPATANDGARARIGKPEHQAVTLTICEGIMDTSIERIRVKIAEMEAKLSNLRIAERELLALETAPAPRTKAAPRLKPKRKPKANRPSPARQTIGAAIAQVLGEHGALPVAEIAGQIKAAGRDIGKRSVSHSLQAMKKQGLVKSGNGRWMLSKARARPVPA